MTSVLEQLLTLAPPPRDVPSGIAWPDVENALGTPLPQDFKRLVELYGPGSFDDFIWVLQPMAQNENIDFASQRDVRLNALRMLREWGHHTPYDVDAGELIPWAITDNGDVFYWITTIGDRPDDWIVVANEARGPEWKVFSGTATEFILGLLTGSVGLDIFPEDFPSDNPEFQPVEGRR